MKETKLSDGILIHPPSPSAALVVISGSSGRLEEERASVLAKHGVAAYAFQWYAGIPAPLENLPLENFAVALDRIRGLAPLSGILGTSFGAEASLLLASHGVSLDLVVALAPTSVVWQSPLQDDAGRPVGVNKWSFRGQSIPGVPYVDRTTWTAQPLETALESHTASLDSFSGDPEEVTIKVENISADLIVSSGGQDSVWQSKAFCDAIVERRERQGLTTTLVHHPDAGHRAVLPGESMPVLPPYMPQSGGTPEANRAHGAEVLATILSHIRSLGTHTSVRSCRPGGPLPC